jgi:hypothetical protein
MNAIVPAFGCATEGVPFNVALARVMGLVTEDLGTNDVPLAACVGRIIAAPLDARLDLPVSISRRWTAMLYVVLT